MFDLEAHILKWRGQYLQDGAFFASDIEELEGHLRDTMDELGDAGLSEEEAFLLAVRRLGDRSVLRREFSSGRTFLQRILRSRPTAAAALLVELLTAAIVPLGVSVFADMVSESGTWLIRAREGASMHVEGDGLYVHDGTAGLINPVPVLAIAGTAFGIVAALAVIGWGLIWQAGSPAKAS